MSREKIGCPFSPLRADRRPNGSRCLLIANTIMVGCAALIGTNPIAQTFDKSCDRAYPRSQDSEKPLPNRENSGQMCG